MMGTDFIIEKGSAALNNCGFVSTIDIETRGSLAFTWTMDALMLGVGIGFDTKGAGKCTIRQPRPADGLSFTVPDSREGWVETLRLTLDAYFLGQKMPDFDFSQIRPYGAPIHGFGGVASGPDPLIRLVESVKTLLDTRIGRELTSTDIVDIMNMIGVCVVAGNVRRSAEIAIGAHDDRDYVTMKDYTLYPEEMKTHRWASNNSVFAEIGRTDYEKIAESIALNGEPGVVWLSNIRKYGRLKDPVYNVDKLAMGVNPCGEQTLESMELCCLVETFPSLHKSYEEYRETLKSAYLYAKSVTLLPTHWEETNAILMKNRRIGTSQSGIISKSPVSNRREASAFFPEFRPEFTTRIQSTTFAASASPPTPRWSKRCAKPVTALSTQSTVQAKRKKRKHPLLNSSFMKNFSIGKRAMSPFGSRSKTASTTNITGQTTTSLLR